MISKEPKVRHGYKMTEVGVIPEDWGLKKVEDVMEFSGGSQPPRDTFIFKPKEGYIRLLQIRDYKTDKYETYIPLELAQKFCSRDDIMIGRYGPPIFQILRGLEGAYNVALIKVFPKDNFDKEYAFYFLKQDKLLNFIEKLSQRSSGQTGVDLIQLKGYPIPLPPTLQEQKRIATALSDVDALIGQVDKLIAKKQAIKQGAMQQLLTGQTRLPGFGQGKGYKMTEVGKIPEDWEMEPIGEKVDLLTGYPFPSNDYSKTGIKLLRGANIKRGRTDWSDTITIYWEKDVQKYSTFELKEGDLVIAMDGSLVGRSYAFLSKSDIPSLLLQRVARLRSKEMAIEFLRYFIGSELFIKYCDSVKTVTAIPHISPGDIRNFQIPLPPSIQEQREISKTLDSLASSINDLRTKKSKLQSLKRGMMQELLTGKTRLI